MRKLTPWLMLLFTVATFAQIPTYYNDVNMTLTGTALKNALATKIINTHTTNLSYTPGVWDALKQTDLDPTDPTKVLLIYGWNDSDGDITNDRTRGVDQNGGGTGVWNREHVYSKSLANPNLGTSGPGADAHNLRPCDAQRNSSRSNRKFEDGSGNSGATAAGNWYPGDEWKGDVARMMMYMYLRYGSQTLPINVGVGTTVASDNNMIMLFLEWNAEDPVSDLEKQRNPVLEGLQGNRNPFIDNPAFATQIWGGPQAEDLFGGGSTDTTAPSTPTNLMASNVAATSFSLSWTASTDNVAVSGYGIFINGSQVGTSNTNNYNATGLTSLTNYTVSVRAFDAAGNNSSQSTGISVNTSAGGNGTATDLLISEYIEGSSNNKAIEVANFTGSTVDLSVYTLKKQTNGSGSWSGGLSLTGQLAHGSVFVAANSSASSAITSVANITTGSSEMTFNGNDAVGLFKNDVLIDILGTFNSSATYAQNVTLQRKSSVTSPNTTYTTTEWNSLATDTFSGLGSHTIDGGSGADTEAPSIPTNLAASNITETSVNLSWNASTDNAGVTSYTIYQGGSLIGTSSTTSFSVTGLTASTAYTFTVRADDAAGNQSNDSNSLNVTTLTPPDTQAPSNPTNLVASNVTQTSVDLSWTASTDNVGVTSYTIYQGGSQIGTSSTTSFGVTSLTASTSYAFTLRANDAAGNQSSDSNSVNVTTNDPPTNTSTILSESYFETGWDNWVDGGSDCYRYSGSRSWEGNYSIRIRDNSGTTSSMTSEAYDISSYDTVEVAFYFYSYSMENNEDFWLRYFDGSSWLTVATYARGTDFENNGFYSSTIILDKNSYNFVNNAQFRFQNDASGNADHIYIDQVTITGKTGSTSRSALPAVGKNIQFHKPKFEDGNSFTLYPNPVSGQQIQVFITNRENKVVTYKVTSLLGAILLSGTLVNNHINIAKLKPGIYLMQLIDGDESSIRKFIKK